MPGRGAVRFYSSSQHYKKNLSNPTGCVGACNRLFGLMLYTQGQVRDLLQVPVETLRRWRGGVPALAQHRGHGPTFSPGDVVALAVVSDLVNLYGLRVNSLSGRLDQLFELCHGCSWLTLETCIILIMPDYVRLTPVAGHRLGEAGGTILIIPVKPIVARLRTKLVSSEVNEPQPRLNFPPTALAGSLR